MELPGGWVRLDGNIDAAGVKINRIELLEEHPLLLAGKNSIDVL